MSSITVGVSGDSPLPSRAGNTDPPGVAPERVDSRTLQIIEHLFPGNKGIEFLALLLRFATIKQLALPGLDLLESTDVAVITLQSIRELSRRIGWSYDTTEKYVVLFCQLRLLYKERHRRQITLHFPLSSCQLPAPEALDALHDYRPKVVQFARRIKKRFVLLRKSPGPGPIFSACSPAASSVPEERSILPGLLFQDICQILHQEVDSDTESRLLLRIEGAFTYRCTQQNGRLLPQTGDSDSESAESDTPVEEKESTLSHKTVDSFVAPTIRNGRLYRRKVDSDSSHLMKESPVSPKKGDSFTDTSLQNGRLSQQKDDSKHKTGDSEHSRGGDAAPNVNVITLVDSITLNVSTVALFCCKVLGEDPGKRGIYSKLFREIDSDAQAITAALIYTLVHREDGTIRKPPAVFIQRCKDYHHSGVPEEAVHLVQRYGHLPYSKLLDALRQKSSPAAQSVSYPQREAPAHQTPASLLPLSSVKASLAPRIPLQAGGGMHREDALRLRTQIAGDRRVALCRTGVVSLPDGTYAVLVDDHTLTEAVRQVVFYSANDWEIRSAHLTSGYELFVPEGQTRPHPFRAFLNKGGQA